MKTGLATVIAAAAVLLCRVAPPTVHAHRLDEFLQATTIAVEKDHVALQVRLTPGVEVSHAVLADLDADGDGILSETERRDYAERVRRDLSLTVDGNRLELRLVSSMFLGVEAIRDGLGDILLTFRAAVPPGGPDRKLIFENHYRIGMTVYLVNCLSPGDPDLRVTAQSRNYEQSFYQLDYTTQARGYPVSTVTPRTGNPPRGR